jgi:hypothetical protein
LAWESSCSLETSCSLVKTDYEPRW